MSALFEPFRIGPMEIPNRFIRSATTSAWADEHGVIRPETVDLYNQLAKGGVGLIVKGHLYVMDGGKCHQGMAGISGDEHIPMLKKLTMAVHERGGRIVAQINHGGIVGVGRTGPSDYRGEGWEARELSVDEIWEVIDAFGDAAERAMAAGFEGVQIHGAHGYLVSQFLSPLLNRRTDDWGGGLGNRMQLLLEVYDEVRSRVGKGAPVLLKMNCDDFTPGGFSITESPKVAHALCRRGLDAVEVSGGGLGRPGDRERVPELKALARSDDPSLKEASYAVYAKKIREATKPAPMALVNGIRSRRCMEAIVEKDIADLISLSRPLIREPDLVRRLMTGQESSTCTSCDACESPKYFGKVMLRCHLDS